MAVIQTVQTLPMDPRRGRNCELRLTQTTPSERPWAVGLFPAGDDLGIAIGVGVSPRAALGDAQDTLQAAQWAINDAILEGVRRAWASAPGGAPGAPWGGVPPEGGP